MGFLFLALGSVGVSMVNLLEWLFPHRIKLFVPPQATHKEHLHMPPIPIDAPILEKILTEQLIPAIKSAVQLGVTIKAAINANTEAILVVANNMTTFQHEVDTNSVLLGQNTASMGQLIEASSLLGDSMATLAAQLKNLTDPPPPAPGKITIVTVEQLAQGEGFMFKFGIAPAPLDVTDPNDNDVVKRIVTATNTTKGTPAQTATITQPAVDTSGACYAPGLILVDDAGNPFLGDAGDSIALTDQVTDFGQNVSPVESNTATVQDNVAPPAPGAVGIQTVAQV